MSLDSIIDLNITIKDAAVSRAGFGTPLILATAAPFSGVVRSYSSASSLASDGFVAADSAYQAALAIFSQSPRPSLVKVGVAADTNPEISQALNEIAAIDDDWYALVLSTCPAISDDLLGAAA